MTALKIPDAVLAAYMGCGTYLAAFRAGGLVAIRKVAEPGLPALPARPKGLRARGAKAQFARALAEAWRARTQAVAEWAAELRAWAPAGADHIVAAGGSCCELVDKFSNLDWRAQDALDGRDDDYFGILGKEERAAAYARDAFYASAAA